MFFKIFSLAVLAICIAALAFWHPQEEVQQQPDEHLVTNDLYLETFELEAYGSDGRVTHITRGDILARDADSGSYSMQAPKILMSDEAGRDWLLQAIDGEMDADMSTAVLEGDVTLTTENDSGIRLTTPRLEVDTINSVINSTAGVVIAQGRNVIQSENLAANLKTGALELSENVEGVYVPR